MAEMMQDLGGNPTCTVINQNFRTSVLNAALLNCALVRSQDFTRDLGLFVDDLRAAVALLG